MIEKRKFIVLVAVMALALAFVSGPGSTYAATSVFVNEIHYDNDGTDTGEAIEIAGPAGTDLAGWSLVLYNGNGGAVYNTVALSGVIADQQNGFGTLDFPIAGIQNGSPDGFALVDPTNNVVQFLSYEGTLTAVDGPANGMTSTDIGVSEPSDTPIGESLQLTGTGATDEDFTWAAPAVSTFGTVNTGQTFEGGTPTPVGQPLPLSEGFDDCTLAGWEIISLDADTTNTWSCSTTYSNIEANGYGDTAPADEWLITPSLDLNAQDNDTLTFRNYTNYSDVDYPTLSVLYSTNYVGDGDPASATWTELSGINFSPVGSGTWVDSGEIDLSGISGTNVHIAFHYVSSGTGGGTAATWRIDSVNVFEGTPPEPPTGDLFFSEYIEGSSFNKALEIYNSTGAEVDLSAYTVELYSNGATSPTLSATLSGTLANGDVFVIANSSASAAILAVTDMTSGVANFNGDDALVLRKEGVIIDSFGQVGTDPGSEWPGGGADDTLRRKADICAGDTDPSDVFDASLEWDTFAQDTFDGLGSHTSDCVPVTGGQPLPLAEGFDDCTLAGWEIVSVDTDTAHTWSCNAYYSNIEANGYGDDAPADEWLITPPLDMDAQPKDLLTFRSYTQYSDIDYPQLEVLYSADYDGSGDPAAATWTALSGITFSPEASKVWTDSGEIDLSGITGNNVYFAFHYTSSGTSGGSAATWRLDSINFYEDNHYKIHEIQGDGAASPVVGKEVIIEGIVVGDFQEFEQLGGFHVQEEDADVDGDPATSEGVYVYNYSDAVDVGDLVEVTGTVAEYNGLTEITYSTVTVISSGNSVAATAVSLPVVSLDDLEAYEGMLVTFEQDLYISEFFNFDRYGEIVLSTERQYQPTATFDPGSPEAAAMAEANNLARITLDDGVRFQNPDPARHPNGLEFTTDNYFRGGDILQNVTGVIDYANDKYKIQPTQGADYLPQNLRTEAPDEVGGTIKVASFNVLNYFTTFGSRGADDAVEFQRQRDKIFAALAAMDADIVGLIEIENNAPVAISDLVTGLNELVGADTYAYIDTGVIGDDEIAVAFIYKPASVKLVGNYAVLDDVSFTDPLGYGEAKNRPALAQTFYDRYTGGNVTIVVNHLKSKGSSCGDGDDDPEAGSCNLTRTLAAQALVDWLATDPTGSGDPDVLIIGDLNSYDKEDPIDAILAGPDDLLGNDDDYADLLYNFIGEDAYSYVFDGALGYLDHGLANVDLLPQVTGTTVWHINADEADLIDYDMTFKEDAQDALWEPTAYRSSDHDPVVIGLQLEPEGPIVNDDGCYVVGLEGTPYGYAYNLVTTDSYSLKEFRHGSHDYMFKAIFWAYEQGLPWDSCFEIHGTDKKDMIFAGVGNDVIFGYNRHDTLFGSKGDDVFTGGNGRDYFFGSIGFDTVLDYTRGDRCVNIEDGCW